MASTISTITAHCNQLLEIGRYRDHCPNGLQVEGGNHVQRLVTGVTASLALLEAAAEWKADLVIVHHGYFWKSDNPTLTGARFTRVRTLIEAQMGLAAYHLPLDVHPTLGNNAQLASHMGWITEGTIRGAEPDGLLHQGRLPRPVTPDALAQSLRDRLQRMPIHIGAGRGTIERIAWCTGAGQGLIEAAAAEGVDAFITGEASEQTTHSVRELEVEFFACGHHATERYGVRALGDHLAAEFDLKHRFIDIPNPI